jgi:hypothetical protein
MPWDRAEQTIFYEGLDDETKRHLFYNKLYRPRTGFSELFSQYDAVLYTQYLPLAIKAEQERLDYSGYPVPLNFENVLKLATGQRVDDVVIESFWQDLARKTLRTKRQTAREELNIVKKFTDPKKRINAQKHRWLSTVKTGEISDSIEKLRTQSREEQRQILVELRIELDFNLEEHSPSETENEREKQHALTDDLDTIFTPRR